MSMFLRASRCRSITRSITSSDTLVGASLLTTDRAQGHTPCPGKVPAVEHRAHSTTARQPLHSASSTQEPTFNDDYFYKYYLNRDNTRRLNIRACDWLATLNIKQLYEELPSELRDDPLSILSDLTASPDVVKKALELFCATGIESGRAQDRERHIAAKSGSRALYWFLASGNRERIDLTENIRLADLLVYCIVAQKEVEYLWQWVSSDHVPSYAKDWHRNLKHQWRLTILMELGRASAYWDGMYEAVRILLRAIKIDRMRRVGVESPYLPLSSLGTWIDNQLAKDLRQPCSAKTYDVLISTFPIWEQERTAREYHYAKLMLYHPTRASPQPMLDFFSRYGTDGNVTKFVARFQESQDQDAGQSMSLRIIVAARRLKNANRLSDAHRLLDIGRTCLPDFFACEPPRLEPLGKQYTLRSAVGIRGETERMERIYRLRERARQEEEAATWKLSQGNGRRRSGLKG